MGFVTGELRHFQCHRFERLDVFGVLESGEELHGRLNSDGETEGKGCPKTFTGSFSQSSTYSTKTDMVNVMIT